MEKEELKYYLNTLAEEEKDDVILSLATNQTTRDNLKELFLFGEERAKQIIKSYDEYLDRIQNGELYLSVIDNGEYWSDDSVVGRDDHLIILNLKYMVNKFKRILETSQRRAIHDLIRRLLVMESEMRTYDEYDENYNDSDEDLLINLLVDFGEDVSFLKEFAYLGITILSDGYLDREINAEIMDLLIAFNGSIKELMEFYPFKKHRYHEAVLKVLKGYLGSKKKDNANTRTNRMIEEMGEADL